jgi:hypothetical protein
MMYSTEVGVKGGEMRYVDRRVGGECGEMRMWNKSGMRGWEMKMWYMSRRRGWGDENVAHEWEERWRENKLYKSGRRECGEMRMLYKNWWIGGEKRESCTRVGGECGEMSMLYKSGGRREKIRM